VNRNEKLNERVRIKTEEIAVTVDVSLKNSVFFKQTNKQTNQSRDYRVVVVVVDVKERERERVRVSE